MFEHGSLQQVVDQEKEPCGCPPPSKTEVNEFPLAESEGLAPTPPSPQASAIKQPAANDEAATTLVHNASENTPQTVAIPPPPPAQIATTTASLPAQEAGAEEEAGSFQKDRPILQARVRGGVKEQGSRAQEGWSLAHACPAGCGSNPSLLSAYGFRLATAQGMRRITSPGLLSWNIKLHCSSELPKVAP